MFTFYETNDAKIPILLEEQTDADGKARAIRIGDGQFLKDDKGQEVKFASADLTAVETDMKLRSAIQQTLDSLALSDPNPDARSLRDFEAWQFRQGKEYCVAPGPPGKGDER